MLHYYDTLSKNFPLFIGLIFVFGIINFIIFRRHIFSIFDPWFYFIAQITLTASVLSFFYFSGETSFDIFFYICLCVISFGMGIKLFHSNNKEHMQSPRNIFSSSQIKLMCYLLLFANIISIGIMYAKNGIPILSGNPNETKILVSQGVGLFKRIALASDYLLLAFALTAGYIYNQKFIYYLSISWMVLQRIMLGSRSSFLILVFAFALAFYFLCKYYGINKGKVLIILGAFAIIWLFVSASITSVYDNVFFVETVLMRAINDASGPFSYFIQGAMNEFAQIGFWDKVQYYFSDVIMALKLYDQEKIPNIGYLIVKFIWGRAIMGFGPFPTMFVDGHILFGFGGVIYCFLIGILMSFSRYKVNNMVLFIFLGLIVPRIITDGGYFFSHLFDCALIFGLFLFGVIAADRRLYMNKINHS